MISNNNIIFRIFRAMYLNASSRWPVGTNIFERDWDILLVLDTCRTDALKEVAPEYDFIEEENVESIVSVGSTSPEWIAKTFDSNFVEDINETIYISGNPFSQSVLHDREFVTDGSIVDWTDWSTVHDDELLDLDQPWQYVADPVHGPIRPQIITDRVITQHREKHPKRLIAHYMQPHAPYTTEADAEEREELYIHEQDPIDYLENGGDLETVWKLYLENLRMALDSIEILLNNVEAEKVVITSDHGESFGEYGFYGHPAAAPHPHIKRVPWATTTATNQEEYVPTTVKRDQSNDAVADHLESLGYL